MNSGVNAIASELVALNIPYLEGGRDAQGVDCYGILIMFMERMGIELPDITCKPDWFKNGGNLLIENYHEYADEVTRDDLQPGDVIMFENYPGVANHFGVFLGCGKFLHADKGAGAVILRLNSQPHSRRVHSCYRMKAQ